MTALISILFAATPLARAVSPASQRSTADADSWPTYGGDAGGQRFSSNSAINRSNVARLRPAWVFHTNALSGRRKWQERASFEATPILFKRTLYLATPFDQIIALDPSTGIERWHFDPQVKNIERVIITSRGVSAWTSGKRAKINPEQCADRILLGTLDARLLALDAATGAPCQDFGDHGSVDLKQAVALQPDDQYEVTSAPTIVGDIVVVGSSIGDNHRVEEERGIVRAYDVRSGRLLWTWNPIPWAEHAKLRSGGANAWSTIAADLQHGLIFIPTSSPSPDFYGVERPGDNRDADSIVALDVHTGEKRWAFQVVHHDLWDYDIASEPLLFTFRGTTPAVSIATKMGTIFVLNRLTGEPLYPVNERPVPQSTVKGEETSPTQPISALPPLIPDALTPDQAWGPTETDRLFCHDKIAGLRNEGVFTPPSVQGSLLFPGTLGGVNWGSTAFDPSSGMLYANTNNQAFLVRLSARDPGWWHDDVVLPLTSLLNEIRIPWLRNSSPFRWFLTVFWPDEGFQTDPERTLEGAHFGKEFSPSLQTPFFSVRQPLISPSGLPCNPPPWGTLTALNLNTGVIAWQSPLGMMGGPTSAGSHSLGGPIVTAGGLVFTAGSKDPNLRAFDAANGRELWSHTLPVPAQATPMTYTFEGRQYIVICAGGHGNFGTPQGDSVLAFAISSTS